MNSRYFVAEGCDQGVILVVSGVLFRLNPLLSISGFCTMFKAVKTPCVGICSTGIGDTVCRGCKRFTHEVISWNAYTNDQRRSIATRLEQFLTQVVSSKLQLIDESLLVEQLKHQSIRYNPDQNAYCWINDLLRAGASQLGDLAHYGLARQAGWETESLVEIKDAIDRDYYTLSCAHYERYIAPGQVLA